jgi:hypothetical protein
VTPRQKLRSLIRSVNRATSGLTKIVHCPYCGQDLDFTPPSVLSEDWQPPTCCAEFALAMIAILQRVEQSEMKDLADRIKSNVGGPAVFN